MSLLDYFIAHPVSDFTAVFTSDFQQVFPKARIMKPIVKESAKGMEHPVESGTVKTDHVVINPVEIELPVIVRAPDLEDTYQTIKQYFLKSTTVMIQTKTSLYEDMYITDMPHEEDPDMFDAVAIAISFKQILVATTEITKIVPKDPVNIPTVNRGVQSPVAPNPSSTFLLDTFGGYIN